MIPYSRQSINQADIDAVVSVLRSDFLTQGTVVSQFEQAVADYCQARHAIAVTNASDALHMACLALGTGQGDRIWTSPNTFVASANCALQCGAQVDFVDIDPRTGNISLQALARKLAQAHKYHMLPKVLIVVHFAGQACQMQEIFALTQQYGIALVEDAAHALGATYKGQPVGNCRYSDITVFSFHPVKMITTAEGGMLLTNHSDVAEKLRLLGQGGITRDPEKMIAPRIEAGWYYQMLVPGFNRRMNEIQAALGLSQFSRLDNFVQKRRQLAQNYFDLLRDTNVQLPYINKECEPCWHLFVIQIASRQRALLYDYLRQQGIMVQVHYIPLHTHPYYRQLGFQQNDFPNAIQFYQGALSLPLYVDLSETQQDEIVSKIRFFLSSI